MNIQKHFLNQIIGFSIVSKNSPTHTMNRAGKTTKEIRKGFPFANRNPSDQDIVITFFNVILSRDSLG
jgi:hypothetical protein